MTMGAEFEYGLNVDLDGLELVVHSSARLEPSDD
jgi:hypothetical protein